MLLLGNDIVSLKKDGIQNESHHTRFINRVFTPAEGSTITNSVNSELTLWTFWAAKEAGYKVISKLESPPVFSHKQFEVVKHRKIYGGLSDISVAFSGHIFSGFADVEENYVHVILASEDFAKDEVLTSVHLMSENEKQQWKDERVWRSHFSGREMASIHHFESAFIRFLCKNLVAKFIKVDASQLEIIRPTAEGKPGPPYLLIDDQPCHVDISLSHHESWLAWVISTDAECARAKGGYSDFRETGSRRL